MAHLDESIGGTLPTILVTDALGVIGYRVAQKILSAGHSSSVRVGVSDLTRAEHFKEQGANVVAFDFDRPATYKPALQGVKSIYLAIPDHENWRENFEEFLKVVKDENVSNIVKLSICHSFIPKHDPFSKVPLVQMHRETDDKIALSNINYTIIMASHFMSNPTVYQEELLRKEHRFIGASGSKGVAYVSPNDVSDVAVKSLLNPNDFQKKTLHITGAGVITDTEIAEALRYVRVCANEKFVRRKKCGLTVIPTSYALNLHQQRSRNSSEIRKQGIGVSSWRSKGNRLGSSRRRSPSGAREGNWVRGAWICQQYC